MFSSIRYQIIYFILQWFPKDAIVVQCLAFFNTLKDSVSAGVSNTIILFSTAVYINLLSLSKKRHFGQMLQKNVGMYNTGIFDIDHENISELMEKKSFYCESFVSNKTDNIRIQSHK